MKAKTRKARPSRDVPSPFANAPGNARAPDSKKIREAMVQASQAYEAARKKAPGAEVSVSKTLPGGGDIRLSFYPPAKR